MSNTVAMLNLLKGNLSNITGTLKHMKKTTKDMRENENAMSCVKTGVDLLIPCLNIISDTCFDSNIEITVGNDIQDLNMFKTIELKTDGEVVNKIICTTSNLFIKWTDSQGIASKCMDYFFDIDTLDSVILTDFTNYTILDKNKDTNLICSLKEVRMENKNKATVISAGELERLYDAIFIGESKQIKFKKKCISLLSDGCAEVKALAGEMGIDSTSMLTTLDSVLTYLFKKDSSAIVSNETTPLVSNAVVMPAREITFEEILNNGNYGMKDMVKGNFVVRFNKKDKYSIYELTNCTNFTGDFLKELSKIDTEACKGFLDWMLKVKCFSFNSEEDIRLAMGIETTTMTFKELIYMGILKGQYFFKLNAHSAVGLPHLLRVMQKHLKKSNNLIHFSEGYTELTSNVA